MKYFLSLALIVTFAIQSNLSAQTNTTATSHLEMQVQQIPSEQSGMNGQPSSQVRTQVKTDQKEVNNARNPTKTIDNVKPQKIERTLTILKPDAVKNRHVGDIISRFEDKGLHVIGIKMTKLSNEQAAQFYKVHSNRPFYSELVQFMSSGPVVVLVLEGDYAISKARQIMGTTDPSKADKGTIRRDFAQSITKNAVHGSDSPENAQEEIKFFFQPNELY